jgi:hypothetical protein
MHKKMQTCGHAWRHVRLTKNLRPHSFQVAQARGAAQHPSKERQLIAIFPYLIGHAKSRSLWAQASVLGTKKMLLKPLKQLLLKTQWMK